MFGQAKEGRTWYTLDLGTAAEKLGQERSRLVRAVEYLEQQGWVELQVADVRQQYSIIRRPPDVAELVSILSKRFERREQQEVGRIAQVLDLVTRNDCQTNMLVGYFGEIREAPCGHCTWCRTNEPQRLPEPRSLPPVPAKLNTSVLATLQREYRDALGDPRQSARFLCGLTSPALTKYKLTGHSLFGIFEDRRFVEVLAWVGIVGIAQ
jgi:ATP-dependent DNA helicase RecQ